MFGLRPSEVLVTYNLNTPLWEIPPSERKEFDRMRRIARAHESRGAPKKVTE